MTDLGEIKTSAAGGPVTFKIDGVDMQAVAALPADDYAKFLGVIGRMSKIAEQFNELKDKKTTSLSDETLELFNQFNKVCVEGLDLTLFDDSKAYVISRLKDRANPMDMKALSETFGMLANHYNSLGRDDDTKEGTGPFDSENGSSSGSESTSIGDGSVPTSSAAASPPPALENPVATPPTTSPTPPSNS